MTDKLFSNETWEDPFYKKMADEFLKKMEEKREKSLSKSIRVKIQKVAASENPIAPTPEMSAYKCGEENGDVSLPIEYWIKGELVSPIKVGLPIRVFREERNGVMMTGLFTTSPVFFIEEIGDVSKIRTRNSVYTVEQIV